MVRSPTMSGSARGEKRQIPPTSAARLACTRPLAPCRSSPSGCLLSSSRYSEQSIDVDMRLEMRGERIEGPLNFRLVAVSRRRAAEPFDPGAALGIVGEEAMHIGPGNAAVRR